MKYKITKLSKVPPRRIRTSFKGKMPGFEPELHRLRLDRWRIVYLVTEADKTVDVLALCKRPPYDYGDLEKLLEEVQ